MHSLKLDRVRCNLFWIDSTQKYIFRADTIGGAHTSIASGGFEEVDRLDLDPRNSYAIYYTIHSAAQLLRTTADGGAAQVLGADSALHNIAFAPRSVSLDLCTRSVYFEVYDDADSATAKLYTMPMAPSSGGWASARFVLRAAHTMG